MVDATDVFKTEDKTVDAADAATAAAAKVVADKAIADKEAADKVVADTAAADAKAAADKSDKDADKDAGKDKSYDQTIWGSTGTEIGDGVLQLLSESGVTVADAKALLYDAVTAGDVSNIDRDTLVDKVGKTNATLILGGINTFVQDEKAKGDKAVASIYDAAGGKDAWDTMIPWIKANVSEDDMSEYRPLLDAGGKQAAFAVDQLKAQYNADPKNEKLDKRVIEGSNKSVTKEPGITQRQYGDALTKLHRTNKATPEARAALQAARKRGKTEGL